MAVGTSQPTVVATKDGRIGMKNQMQVCVFRYLYMLEYDLFIRIINLYISRLLFFCNWRNANLQVNVTADHRVIYGSDLALFLQTLSQIIEDPKDLTF
jgi:pyruvate dehydrogenase E2 component (dihydrolipoamide acetyltransferase)